VIIKLFITSRKSTGHDFIAAAANNNEWRSYIMYKDPIITRMPGHLYFLDHDPHSPTFKIVTYLGNILYVLCRDILSRWLSRSSGLLDSLIICGMTYGKTRKCKKNLLDVHVPVSSRFQATICIQKTKVSKFKKC